LLRAELDDQNLPLVKFKGEHGKVYAESAGENGGLKSRTNNFGRWKVVLQFSHSLRSRGPISEPILVKLRKKNTAERFPQGSEQNFTRPDTESDRDYVRFTESGVGQLGDFVEAEAKGPGWVVVA